MPDFYTTVRERRTYYNISKNSPVSDECIKKLIKNAILYSPSAFNSQSARVVLLFGENHDKLWQITLETLRKIVPEKDFAPTEERINSFMAGYGTILYFEDDNPIKQMQEEFPLYKDSFPKWSLESSGMIQFVVWASLEKEGLGASLQHYNPLIDEEVKAIWNIPPSWQLIAEMPFGTPTAQPDEKTFLPFKDRFRVEK